MQAVILVGGEGTRLRPLTSGTPKPIVTFVDRPFMGFMLEWLARHGVQDVVMCCGFKAEKVREVLGDGGRFGVALTYVEEPDPRGTAGALKFAEHLLQDRFLMLNGDVLTDVDLTAQIAQHEATGATGTLGLVEVSDPSAYGLVLTGEDSAVSGFLEKPGPDQLEGVERFFISAGMYVLERSVVDMIAPDVSVSIEREIWPRLVGAGLYGYAAEGAYWMDIGTPERYLQGTADILTGAVQTAAAPRNDGDLAAGAEVDARALVEPGARLAAGARVVGPSVLGRGSELGEGAVVERSVVLDGARIGAGARVSDAILAPGAVVGERARVEPQAVLGVDVEVAAGAVVERGAKVFPPD